ncbi:hypothetical protein YN1HA_18010 [Sulfurisphaera ohwakuensis]
MLLISFRIVDESKKELKDSMWKWTKIEFSFDESKKELKVTYPREKESETTHDESKKELKVYLL